MKTRIIKIFSAWLLVFLFANSALAYSNPGNPTGFVNDYTDTLNSEQKQQLENKLTQFEKDSSNEISLVIIKDLQGDTIENFAEKLFKDWGIGKKDKDNGILVLVAKDDRQMRIEVGYGLEGALTDAQSFWIINNIMKPAFRADDFAKGLNEATDKIIAATKGEVIPGQNNNTENTNLISAQDYDSLSILWACIIGFMWLTAILGRSKSWWLGGVLGGIAGIIIGIINGFFYLGIASIAVLLPVGLLFDFLVSTQYKAGKSRGHIPWWIGGGRSGGGFGGFGGGMSGGGGASGRW
jgi:uncharacterized protein